MSILSLDEFKIFIHIAIRMYTVDEIVQYMISAQVCVLVAFGNYRMDATSYYRHFNGSRECMDMVFFHVFIQQCFL